MALQNDESIYASQASINRNDQIILYGSDYWLWPISGEEFAHMFGKLTADW